MAKVVPSCSRQVAALGEGMTGPDDIPAEWRRIAAQSKTIFGWSEWSDVLGPPSKTTTQSRDELNTLNGETTELVRQLSDDRRVSIIGARLRLTAFAYRREYDVTATLEVAGGRNGVTISRVDAWPAARHGNYKARKHKALRHLSPFIEGHHVHRFEDNAILGRTAFIPPERLPAAVAVDGRLGSFRDFLRVVAFEFAIDADDLNAIQPPPTWQEFLL